MSKPEIAGQPLITRAPEDQVKYFADHYRDRINPESLARLNVRVDDLGLEFTKYELQILAALDTPARVQEFLNTQVYYNNDHAYPGQAETTLAPRRVLQTGIAHCFEGAMFAYAVNFLHGHSPQMVLLEASEDSDHNLVLYQDPQTKMYGCNAHSGFPHLDGRPAEYQTLRALVESYVPYYYSDRTFDPKDLTLVGYSDPFDVIARYGTAWIDSQDELWHIYSTYIDDTLRFHFLFDDSGETHVYPMLGALKSRWIQVDSQGRAFVSVEDLPRAAQELWHAFWRVFDEKEIRPRAEAMDIAKKFFARLQVTPLDLTEYAHELDKYLARGYRVEELFRSKQ